MYRGQTRCRNQKVRTHIKDFQEAEPSGVYSLGYVFYLQFGVWYQWYHGFSLHR